MIKKQTSINPMHEWFKYLFEERMDSNGYVKCFECGGLMHENTYKELTTCYSHILPKSKYPTEKGNSDNVKICHPDCHTLFTIKPSEATNQYKEYLKFKEKYESDGKL